MINAVEVDRFAAGKDLVPASFLVPLRERGSRVHFLDDVSPTDSRVISAERYLTFLSRVGDYALLGAAEIVIEQVLKPHSSDEEKIPSILAPSLDIFSRPVSSDFAIIVTSRPKRLVEFLQQVGK